MISRFMRGNKRLIIGILLLISLTYFFTACNVMEIKQFAGKNPEIHLDQYFVGNLKGYGVFYDRWSNIRTSFKIDLSGEFANSSDLILKENLVYENGEKIKREYRITKSQIDGQYDLFCDDLVKPGSIIQSGNALLWEYTLLQDIGGQVLSLNFEDWMFLQNENLVLNRAKAYWYGIFVGEVFMVINKEV